LASVDADIVALFFGHGRPFPQYKRERLQALRLCLSPLFNENVG